MICDADCKLATNAIRLSRPLMVSFGLPGIRRPGDGKRYTCSGQKALGILIKDQRAILLVK